MTHPLVQCSGRARSAVLCSVHILEVVAAGAAHGATEVTGSGVAAEVAGLATGATILAAVSTVVVAFIRFITQRSERRLQLAAYQEHRDFILELMRTTEGDVTVAEVAQLFCAGPTVGPRAGEAPPAQESAAAEASTDPGLGDTTPSLPRLRRVP